MDVFVSELDLYLGYAFLCSKISIQATFTVHITKQKSKVVQRFDNVLIDHDTKISNESFNIVVR